MASMGDADTEDDEEILDFRQRFHNTVRENVIFFLFFLTLSVVSYNLVGIFWKKKDKQRDGSSIISPGSGDDDESLVYRICFWLCVFSLSISIGATLLLPISIVSNEVRHIYPNTYYVLWLNETLIQGLWNWIFLFANISLFLLLPFAHLFIESEGFSGYKKGLTGKVYETMVILAMVGFAVWGMAYILAAMLTPERAALGGILFGFGNQLPFIYSCISFLGVLLLLVCTPLGVGYLFSFLGGLISSPQFIRNLDDECTLAEFELNSLKNKLHKKTNTTYLPYSWRNYKPVNGVDSGHKNSSKRALKKTDIDMYEELLSPEFKRQLGHMSQLSPLTDPEDEDEESLKSRIKVSEKDLMELEKLRRIPGWKRNLFYPLEFLIVLVLTALTVFMVVINTLQLIVGLKALPLSAQTFSLGLSSMSVLGSWGAALEVILIIYLMTTSLVGLYNIPWIKGIRPKPSDSPTSHIIYNCALVLILSSALPLLSRILGITNFDLLGSYGQIEWLGNFYIVLLYNVIFSVTSTLSLVTKVTRAIRQELVSRLKAVFRIRLISKLWNFIKLPIEKSEGKTISSPTTPATGINGDSPYQDRMSSSFNSTVSKNLFGNDNGCSSTTSNNSSPSKKED